MTETKSLNSGIEGSLLSPQEEAERFEVAAARFRERALRDPAYAEQVLKNIGYYEMMEERTPANGSHSNGSNGVEKSD